MLGVTNPPTDNQDKRWFGHSGWVTQPLSSVVHVDDANIFLMSYWIKISHLCFNILICHLKSWFKKWLYQQLFLWGTKWSTIVKFLSKLHLSGYKSPTMYYGSGSSPAGQCGEKYAPWKRVKNKCREFSPWTIINSFAQVRSALNAILVCFRSTNCEKKVNCIQCGAWNGVSIQSVPNIHSNQGMDIYIKRRD